VTALARLHEHNAWANGRVLAACRAASAQVLEPEGGESLIRRLRHQLAVEASFLAAMRGEPLPTDIPRTVEGLEAFAAACSPGLIELAGSPPEALQRKFRIPWFERDFTLQDGLSQVLSHSGQHRSEVAWELARAGIDCGNLDYIFWVQQV